MKPPSIPLALLLLLAAVVSANAPAAEPSPTPTWPLWDGAESVEQYARRAGLEKTKTLDLGNGMKLEMVLIPAGKFVMGVRGPRTEDLSPVHSSCLRALGVLVLGVLALLIVVGQAVMRAILARQRFQFSLARLVVMAFAAGLAVMGGVNLWRANEERLEAVREYQAAMARYENSDPDEKPAHEVTLTKPFYLGKFEMTQEQCQVTFVEVVGVVDRDLLPVRQTSWNDAQEFCKKVSEKAGVALRLPTEAEWEYACRAGTRTSYYTGDTEADLDRAAWYDKSSGNTLRPVGQKIPNAWGLYDMHGNVWEWVQDFYEPYKAEAVVDPQGPAQGHNRVLRGGCCLRDPRACRSAFRYGSSPDDRDFIIGFRMAMDVPPKAP